MQAQLLVGESSALANQGLPLPVEEGSEQRALIVRGRRLAALISRRLGPRQTQLRARSL